MELGIITDEVHADFEVSCGYIAAWGLPLVEVRNVDGKNVATLSDDEVNEVASILSKHGLHVSGIASPVFKSPIDEHQPGEVTDFSVAGAFTVASQLELLERSCKVAKRLGTRLVRVFTFLRVPWSEEVLDRVVDHMVAAVRVAAMHDIVLAVENEHACVVGTGVELGEFLHRLDDRLEPELSRHVGALWDPGNALAAGEERPYPDGYRALPVERLVHVHLKDLGRDAATYGSFVPLGRGRIDYRSQFAALQRDGYQGDLVLEPHYAPPGRDSTAAAGECVDAALDLLRSTLAEA